MYQEHVTPCGITQMTGGSYFVRDGTQADEWDSVLCTSDKVKVFDRVERIISWMMLLLSTGYVPSRVSSKARPVRDCVYRSIVGAEGV
jgi:hypothetical protein